MNALDTLRERLGSEVYLEVADWHLYGRDGRTPPLADHLAKTLAPLLTPTGIPHLPEVLAGIPIALGGGKGSVSLAECLPPASVRNLERVLEQYAREWLDLLGMGVLIRIGILTIGMIGVILLAGCQGTSWGDRFAQQVGYGPPPTVSPPRVPTDPPQPMSPTALPTPSLPPSVASPLPGDPGLTPREFTDLDTAPFAREAIADLAELEVWQGIPGPLFEPGLSVRRREFARWLVLANNALSGDTPPRLIRLSGSLQRPLFLDVPEDDPDFEVIQTLGSLGIIRGDHRQEFRPNSLLTRADLIAMKLPLDLPPGGLSGSLGELQQAWGFSDSEQIPSYVWPALIGDRQLGEESNVLRVFGVIRTFHAQNPVSRAEVALALSRFHHPLRTPAQVLATPDPSPIPIPTPTTDLSPSPTFSPPPSPTPSPSLPSPPAGRFVQP